MVLPSCGFWLRQPRGSNIKTFLVGMADGGVMAALADWSNVAAHYRPAM
jgi:hypothetical protein